MKALKILFAAVALVMAMPMVTSCSEDEKETEILGPSNSIVGVWEFNCKDGCGKLKEVLTFYPNGQLSIYFFLDEREYIGGELIETTDYGTYSVNGNTIYITLYFYDEGYEEIESLELYLEQGALVDRSDGEAFFYYRTSYDVPSLPDRPEDSDTPEEPNNPSTGEPNTPSNPDQPNTPTNPEEPNNPTMPSAPTTNPLVGTWVYTQQNGTVDKQIFTNDYKYTFIHTELVSGEMRDYIDEFTYMIEGISSNQINIIITAIDGSYSEALTFYTDDSYSYIKEVYNHPAGPEYGIIEDIYYKQ